MTNPETSRRTGLAPSSFLASPILHPPALVLALAGLIVSFQAYSPGAMTWDSFVMWGMGWKWPWHDWHSPYIPLVMGVSRRLVGDPSLLLFFQLLMSWGGLYFCACGLKRDAPVWAALMPLLGLTPMFLVLSGYLHKTPLQASVFLFTFGVVFFHYQWDRRLSWAWALSLFVLLLFGIPLREHGFLCALPLSALGLFCVFRRSGTRAVAGYMAGAVLVGAASLAVHHFVVYRVLEATRVHKIQTLYRYDVAAVYALSGVNHAPRLTREQYLSQAKMRELYDREEGMWRIIYAYEGGLPPGYAVPKDVPERLLTEDEVEYYRSAWVAALTQHPGTWLEHRLHAFATSLGLGTWMYEFRRGQSYRSRQNVFGLYWRGGTFYRPLNRYMRLVEGVVLLKPWFWLAVTAAMLVATGVAWWSRPALRHALLPVTALLSSTTLVYGQLLLTGLDKDLRFSYWALVSSTVSLFLFAATVRRWSRRESGESTGPEMAGDRP